ncbi:MAG: hypothetical protein H0W83_16020, partial [Planctomycetes bacterium]|nr:hypothetical protein [Planctomycetota bacterium]
WHSFLNLCAVTGGALEVSGDLTRVSDHRKARLSRTLALSDPRRSVRCLDLPMGRIVQPPSVWIAEGRTDALVGIFNWSDQAAEVPLQALRAAVGSLTTLEPAWPDQSRPRGSTIALPAHGSVLLRRRGRLKQATSP